MFHRLALSLLTAVALALCPACGFVPAKKPVAAQNKPNDNPPPKILPQDWRPDEPPPEDPPANNPPLDKDKKAAPAPPAPPAPPPPPGIYPALTVGDQGEFRKDKDTYHKARVVRVVNDTLALVRIGRGNNFLLSGVGVKDVADGEEIELRGHFKVESVIDWERRKYKLVSKQK